eukprot:s128_g25.t1
MTAWLGHILQLGVNTTYGAYGSRSLEAMIHEIQHSVANSTFQVLPACFFESITNKGARAADEEIPKHRQFVADTERTRTLLCLSLASLLHLAWANCDASNLLQIPPGPLGALERGRGWQVKGAEVSLSSPEFSALLPKLDAKMEPLTASTMKGDMCLQIVRSLQNTHPTLKHPGVIHTGILLPEGGDNMDGWVETARKLRLLPLSFLASQDLQNIKLYFWANVEQTHPLIQD